MAGRVYQSHNIIIINNIHITNIIITLSTNKNNTHNINNTDNIINNPTHNDNISTHNDNTEYHSIDDTIKLNTIEPNTIDIIDLNDEESNTLN